MATDDEPDDPTAGATGPLPPDDRLWRHPSELGGTVPTSPARPRLRTSLGLAALAGATLTGAAVVGLLWLARSPSTTETGAVEAARDEPASFTPTTLPPDELAGRWARSLVRVEVERDGTWYQGTGVALDEAGTIVVAAPLLAGASRLVARDAEGRPVEATELATDPDTGIAVIGAGGMDGVPLEPAVGELRTGASVSAIAAPGTVAGPDDAQVLSATVSATDVRSGADPWVWYGVAELDRSVTAEGTGCVVVDGAGTLLGLVVANADDDQLAVVVPAADALAVARELRDTGEVARAWLGVQATDLPPDAALELDVAGGAVLTEVTDASPAAEAGLAPDDVVVAVGDAAVADASDLVVALRAHRPGDVVDVEIRRGDEPVTAEVTLGG